MKTPFWAKFCPPRGVISYFSEKLLGFGPLFFAILLRKKSNPSSLGGAQQQPEPSRALARELANLLLILRMEENQKSRDKREPMQTRRSPCKAGGTTTTEPRKDRNQVTQALLALAIAGGTSFDQSANTSHPTLAKAGIMALQSPPVWTAPTAAKIDEMINPACTWHGPLVRERKDRPPEHTKDAITVVCWSGRI